MSFTTDPDVANYYDVHLGVWTNWARGPIFGPTITLTRRNGGLLIAFIALFVTLVGTCFWRLFCLGLHYIYSTEAAWDGLYHQRQAILRNSANGASGLWSLIIGLYKWRGIESGVYRRLAPVIILAAAILVMFGAASGFSSSISSAIGNEVLIRSYYCGALTTGQNYSDLESTTLIVSEHANQETLSAEYAKQCYSNASNPENCHGFVKKHLNVATIKNASCPFGAGICRTEGRNLILDTGFLDSHDDFGINTPPSKRLSHRSVMHCAPLNTTMHEERYQYSDDIVKQSLTRYLLGNLTLNSEVTMRNSTYEYPEISIQELDERLERRYDTEYSLYTTFAYSVGGTLDPGQAQFYPIPELQVIRSDLFIFFLSANGIHFTEETDDDWYSAHRPHAALRYLKYPTAYLQDSPASALACKWQEQWCNPNLPSDRQCTPLLGSNDVYDAAANLSRNAEEAEFIAAVTSAMDEMDVDISTIVDNLGISLLTARDGLFAGYQGPLPSNQWQLEVEHWFSAYLALMQQAYINYATGPSDPRLVPFLKKPPAKFGDPICNQQKIRTNAYTNISIFGLSVIAAIGGIIMILSYTVEPILDCIRRRRSLDIYARLEWTANETLQLQRLAHEGVGAGSWTECDGAVPVTTGRDCLAVLDVDDPKHPRLKLPPATFEELLASNRLEHPTEDVKIVGKGESKAFEGVGDGVTRSQSAGHVSSSLSNFSGEQGQPF